MIMNDVKLLIVCPLKNSVSLYDFKLNNSVLAGIYILIGLRPPALKQLFTPIFPIKLISHR